MKSIRGLIAMAGQLSVFTRLIPQNRGFPVIGRVFVRGKNITCHVC